MSQPADIIDQPHGLGHAKLGKRFWAQWWVGFVALNLAFIATMIVVAPRMGSIAWTIGGGAVVLVFTSALISLCMLPMRSLQKRGLEGKMRPAMRRYTARFLPAMLGYVVGLMAALVLMRELQPQGVLAWLIGVLPAIPTLFAIRAIVLLPREEDDEFLRDGIYQTSMWATGGALCICSLYGFLDLFGVVPNVELWAVFPIWAVCLGFAQIVRGRKFK